MKSNIESSRTIVTSLKITGLISSQSSSKSLATFNKLNSISINKYEKNLLFAILYFYCDPCLINSRKIIKLSFLILILLRHPILFAFARAGYKLSWPFSVEHPILWTIANSDRSIPYFVLRYASIPRWTLLQVCWASSSIGIVPFPLSRRDIDIHWNTHVCWTPVSLDRWVYFFIDEFCSTERIIFFFRKLKYDLVFHANNGCWIMFKFKFSIIDIVPCPSL